MGRKHIRSHPSTLVDSSCDSNNSNSFLPVSSLFSLRPLLVNSVIYTTTFMSTETAHILTTFASKFNYLHKKCFMFLHASCLLPKNMNIKTYYHFMSCLKYLLLPLSSSNHNFYQGPIYLLPTYPTNRCQEYSLARCSWFEVSGFLILRWWPRLLVS